MYTGVLPEVHGIQGYTKPVITVDSLFDSLARSGKRVALVAVENSSMAIIFQNRPIDYFIVPYDDAATEKGLELIAQDRHDVVVVYNQEYDDMIHRTRPWRPSSTTSGTSDASPARPGPTGRTTTPWSAGLPTTATTSTGGAAAPTASTGRRTSTSCTSTGCTRKNRHNSTRSAGDGPALLVF